jgi:HprK-related kinase A
MPAVYLRTGPFVSHVRTSIDSLIGEIARLYPPAWFSPAEPFADFHVELEPPPGIRRWIGPQVLFKIDGESPFKPLGRAQALALFEWGLNGCIGTRAHQFLIYHAAVIERGGRAAILPGTPGAGKSTLTAGLVHRGGWRLLSDELTLVSPSDARIAALARPINLKNQSIALMRDYLPGGVFSAEVLDTAKGTVCLLRAPDESLARVAEPAVARWVIFPRWKADAPARLERLQKGAAMLELGIQSMNYSIHGERGFTLTADLVERCDTLRFEYSKLDDAVAAFDELAARP